MILRDLIVTWGCILLAFMGAWTARVLWPCHVMLALVVGFTYVGGAVFLLYAWYRVVR